MKYNENLTKNHIQSKTYPLVLTNLVDLFIKEGCNLNPSPFDNNRCKVIDGDELEAFLASEKSINKKRSVDLIFVTKSTDNLLKYVQFVEIKLRSQEKFYFLDKFSLREKVSCSSLAMGNSIPIANKYYIVFQTNLLNEAERFLFRINPRLNNDFKAIDVPGLHKLFF